MDVLDHVSDEDLAIFFRRNKTAMSCMEEPDIFLNQLRDHDLIPDKLVKKAIKMDSKEKSQEVYQILEWFEKHKRQKCMKAFWRCVFQQHILQKNPSLCSIKSNLKGLKSNQEPQSAEKLSTTKKSEVPKEKKAAKKKKTECSSASFAVAEEMSKITKMVQTQEKKAGKKRKKSVEEEKMELPGPSSLITLYQIQYGQGFPNAQKPKKAQTQEKKTEKKKKSVTLEKKTKMPGPSIPSKPKQTQSNPPTNPSFYAQAISENQLQVTSGDKIGMLHKDRLSKGQKCVEVQNIWYTAAAFGKFAENGTSKNWKTKIHWQNIPLQKLIKDGCLQLPPPKRRSVQMNPHPLVPFNIPEGPSSSSGMMEEVGGGAMKMWNQLEAKLQKQQANKDFSLPAPASGTKEEVGGGSLKIWKQLEARLQKQQANKDFSLPAPASGMKEEVGGGAMKMWKQTEARSQKQQANKDFSLPVSGMSTQSTSTQHYSFTPVKQEVTQSHGAAIKPLVKQKQDYRVLCFICNSVTVFDGGMVSCSACPRYFHRQCHLPTLQHETLGKDWMCTFCVWKANEGLWRHMTKEEALNSRVFINLLRCEYLLLCMYKEDVLGMITKDNMTKKQMEGYGTVVSNPMCLDRVKTKLQDKVYKTVREFVNDMQLIFDNCILYMDNEFTEMGSRMSKTFMQEFHKVFKIQ